MGGLFTKAEAPTVNNKELTLSAVFDGNKEVLAYSTKIKHDYFGAGLKQPILQNVININKKIAGAYIFSHVHLDPNEKSQETKLYHLKMDDVKKVYTNDLGIQNSIKEYNAHIQENPLNTWYIFIFQVKDSAGKLYCLSSVVNSF